MNHRPLSPDHVAFPPIHPGTILKTEFMVPYKLSARAVARDLEVPANRITAIIGGSRAITAETALLLGQRFKTSAEFWLNLQVRHDLEQARQKVRKG